MLQNKHETEVIQSATREMDNFEQKCRELLIDFGPETSGDETPTMFHSPMQLMSSFRHIVLFLLCNWLHVSEQAVDTETINTARNRANESLREAEGALLRLTEHTEIDIDQIGDESIRTADTLLGLLLENALQLSCRERIYSTKHAGKVQCDLEYSYSKYTADCVSASLPGRQLIGNSVHRLSVRRQRLVRIITRK
jgi:hypothetical protein